MKENTAAPDSTKNLFANVTQMAANVAVDLRFNNVSLYAAPLIEDGKLSDDTVWVSVEWDSGKQLAEQATIGSRQASILEDKIKSLAIHFHPSWHKKKLLTRVSSFDNLQAEILIYCQD